MLADNTLRDKAKILLRVSIEDPHAEFRKGQWEAIEALTQRRERILLVKRTGWGKSVVYFLATRILRDQGSGPTLLISPLLALMRNQILASERIGVHAATINSSNRDEWDQVKSELLEDHVDILLISPERLANDEFREDWLLPIASNVGLFVVDEAHCISDWGHDFRPDYLRIVRVLQALPGNVPLLATTATANDRVVEDVTRQLGSRLAVMRGALARDTLRLQNIYLPSKAERMAWLAERVPELPGSGVIYTLTIRDAQRLAEFLQSELIDAHAYWGDLDSEQRVSLEDRLLRNEIKVLVATTALGMGYDKPDLGFVIHFQRPASVVHYYQQVGRAGRAVEEAFGILLSGEEDEEITDYFIRTAFPPAVHVEDVLSVLQEAEEGLSIPMMLRQLNLRYSDVEKVLKILAVQSPAPVSKKRHRWYANPIKYETDRNRIARLMHVRRMEQATMLDYLHTEECLMAFLRRELSDPIGEPCGRCANCMGHPLISEAVSGILLGRAQTFLKRSDQAFQPRKRWPSGIKDSLGWSGNINENLRPEEGRTLCIWGDVGWGDLVRRGKQVDDYFDQELVGGAADFIRSRWRPDPFPTWVTCVPSLKNPTLVSDFARRVAAALRLPFVPVIKKIRETAPQKNMQNSYQQVNNLCEAFLIEGWHGMRGPVLLMDDMVDSRWTFTITSALLRDAGSGPVFPFALALVQGDQR
jgi:ATP-dependent DNA helicase RecQ